MMTDLVAFLRARASEWETAAQPLLHLNWAGGEGHIGLSTSASMHIALHGPVITLRVVAAVRAIVTRYEFACGQADSNVGAEKEAWEKIAGALECDASDLAGIWRHHPDYDEAWKS